MTTQSPVGHLLTQQVILISSVALLIYELWGGFNDGNGPNFNFAAVVGVFDDPADNSFDTLYKLKSVLSRLVKVGR